MLVKVPVSWTDPLESVVGSPSGSVVRFFPLPLTVLPAAWKSSSSPLRPVILTPGGSVMVSREPSDPRSMMGSVRGAPRVSVNELPRALWISIMPVAASRGVNQDSPNPG